MLIVHSADNRDNKSFMDHVLSPNLDPPNWCLYNLHLSRTVKASLEYDVILRIPKDYRVWNF